MASSDVGLGRWPEPYPKSELRADVEAMVEAITGALVSNHGDAIAGLWLKGSAAKSWDTPIDYVPELSDVDIHYRVLDGQNSKLSDLDAALRVHADIGRRFFAGRPRPFHTPRPQFVPLEKVEQSADYVPSPLSTVRTLFGQPPPDLNIETYAVEAIDAQNLIEAGDPQVLEKSVIDLVERPGRHLYTALRHLNWRLSPVASRALSILGLGYEVAWSVNRTQAVHLLRTHAQEELATQYNTYYEAAWEFFLSRWNDEDAGRSAFLAAVRALRLGRQLARSSGLVQPHIPNE